jgi:hypothetical protein
MHYAQMVKQAVGGDPVFWRGTYYDFNNRRWYTKRGFEDADDKHGF